MSRTAHSIRFHFFFTGHTKFSPDACFGLIKRKFRCTNVSLVDYLARVVNESAACNLCQLVGTQDGQTIVPSRDCAVSLLQFSLPGWYQSPPGWYQAVPSLPALSGTQEDCHSRGDTVLTVG